MHLQLPLQPGWTAQDGANCADGPPSYYVSGHIVYLTGAVLHTQSGNGVFAVLPPAARPAHTLYLTAGTEGAPHADVRISPDGQMFLFGGAAPLWASLGGISYQQGS